ncbi:AAA family ATPase [Bosea sp. RAC05]|uniref:AAA family ATPase n=1 Tax=Bosea sp. RAC05 TaxID=1842539 RepID=UPI00083D9D35|nr:AAA family ATPase [Bosea sp. RAC05]AOG02867.1 AAA domain protein [Bosea sp. RAC05]
MDMSPETRVARSAERLARLEGRREALSQRRAVLEKDVGEAKGRLLVKREVEEFIDEIQADAGRRQIESFETLLTALVGEVLPGEKPIAMTLSTERGMPALDISSRHPSGALEDIFRNQGGALTNVVSMGLRLAAVVKSGLARFVALDEADCWIIPDRVPSFYRVLQDAASRLDIQCLVVSHHDEKYIDAGVRISRVSGKRMEHSEVNSGEPDPSWSDEAEGLRYIRLVNFQAFPDATLHLGPGMNVVVGANNLGKSVFVRALRALFLGETDDGQIRHGTKMAVVEVGLRHNRILRFSRQPGRNPVNLWTLLDASGAIVTDNGIHHETGGREPPAWLQDAFAIRRIDGMDVHLSTQKQPVFLLDEPPSRRANVLSVGRESGYARSMLAIHKERCTRDQSVVREGEKELGLLIDQSKKLDQCPDIAEKLQAARVTLADLAQTGADLKCLQDLVQTLASARQAAHRTASRQSILRRLPDAGMLVDIQADGVTAEAIETISSAIVASVSWRSLAAKRAQILDTLPEVPVFESIERYTECIRTLYGLQHQFDSTAANGAILGALPDVPEVVSEEATEVAASTIAKLRQAKRERAAEEARLRIQEQQLNEEAEALAAEFGASCPTCGGAFDAGHVFEHKELAA